MENELALKIISEQIHLRELCKAVINPNTNHTAVKKIVKLYNNEIIDSPYNNKTDLLTKEITSLKNVVRQLL